MLPAAGAGVPGAACILTPPLLPASLPFLPGGWQGSSLPEVLLQGHSGGCSEVPFIPNPDIFTGLNDPEVLPPCPNRRPQEAPGPLGDTVQP